MQNAPASNSQGMRGRSNSEVHKPPRVQDILRVEFLLDGGHESERGIGSSPDALMRHLAAGRVREDDQAAVVGGGGGLQVADQGAGEAVFGKGGEAGDHDATGGVGL